MVKQSSERSTRIAKAKGLFCLKIVYQIFADLASTGRRHGHDAAMIMTNNTSCVKEFVMKKNDASFDLHKSDNFQPHPVGTFAATIVGLSLEEGDYGVSTRFVFQTDAGKIRGFASGTEYTRANKLGRWISSILGTPLADLVKVNSSDIIGRSCLIEVGLNDKGDTRVLVVMPAPVTKNGAGHLDVAPDQVPF